MMFPSGKKENFFGGETPQRSTLLTHFLHRSVLNVWHTEVKSNKLYLIKITPRIYSKQPLFVSILRKPWVSLTDHPCHYVDALFPTIVVSIDSFTHMHTLPQSWLSDGRLLWKLRYAPGSGGRKQEREDSFHSSFQHRAPGQRPHERRRRAAGWVCPDLA